MIRRLDPSRVANKWLSRVGMIVVEQTDAPKKRGERDLGEGASQSWQEPFELGPPDSFETVMSHEVRHIIYTSGGDTDHTQEQMQAAMEPFRGQVIGGDTLGDFEVLGTASAPVFFEAIAKAADEAGFVGVTLRLVRFGPHDDPLYAGASWELERWTIE